MTYHTCDGACSSCSSSDFFNMARDEFKAQGEFTYDPQVHSRPSAAVLALTNRCNLACPYCFVAQDSKDITLKIAEQAIEYLFQNTIRPTIIFFGGEPLLKFDDIIKPLVEKYSNKVQWGVTTNGTHLTPDVVDFLHKNNVPVLLSFDGVKKVQDKGRPGKGFSSYDKVMANIPYLLLRFPATPMRATLTKQSIAYLFENYILAKEMGFQSFTFIPNEFEEWGEEDEELYKKELNKIAEDIYVSLLKTGSAISIPTLVTHVNKITAFQTGRLTVDNSVMRCGLGTTSCAITPSGDIIPCQEKTSNPTHIIGNVFDGIDYDTHKTFLVDYQTKVNKIQGHSNSLETGLITLSTICPSRLEDLEFNSSITIQRFTEASAAIARRLHYLCAESIIPAFQQYFNKKGEGQC